MGTGQGTADQVLTTKLQQQPISWPDSMVGKNIHLVKPNEVVRIIPPDKILTLQEIIDAHNRQASQRISGQNNQAEWQLAPMLQGSTNTVKLLVGDARSPASMYTTSIFDLQGNTPKGWNVLVFPYFQSQRSSDASKIVSVFDGSNQSEIERAIRENRKVIYPVDPGKARMLNIQPSKIIVPSDCFRIITPA